MSYEDDDEEVVALNANHTAEQERRRESVAKMHAGIRPMTYEHDATYEDEDDREWHVAVPRFASWPRLGHCDLLSQEATDRNRVNFEASDEWCQQVGIQPAVIR